MRYKFPIRTILFFSFVAVLLLAQDAPAVPNTETAPAILFIGNSFTFGAGSPVRFYRAQSVADLNGEGTGGVPALFKMFAAEAGRDFRVSLETVGGKNLDYHVANKAVIIGQAWDYVVAQGYS